MNDNANKNEEGFPRGSESLEVDRMSELKVVPGGEIINNTPASMEMNRDIGDFFYDLKPTRDAGIGLTEQTIDYIVDVKGEPDWMREFRKNAYHVFKSKPLPTHWAGDELKEIDFDLIRYYLASGDATKAELGRGS